MTENRSYLNVIIVATLVFVLNSCTQSIVNTKWIGQDKNDDIELWFGAKDGYIIKHYSETDADTFKVEYEQKGNTVLVLRNDETVSAEQQFSLNGNKLESEGLTFLKIE